MRLPNIVPAHYRKRLRKVQRQPSFAALRHPPQQRRERSELSRKETLFNTVRVGQLFSGAGNSTFDKGTAAPRAKLLIFCHADAGNNSRFKD